MLLKIKSIPDGRSVLSQNVTVEGEQAAWVSIVGAVRCRADIDAIQQSITAHVFYECTVGLECSRCLKRFEFPLQGDFYSIIKKRSPDRHQISPEQEESDFFYDDTTDELDISGALIDEMLLALPMKPLCSENCPGISMQKEIAIDASSAKKTDPRWETLNKLKSKKN
jgi:uncharacterized protein